MKRAVADRIAQLIKDSPVAINLLISRHLLAALVLVSAVSACTPAIQWKELQVAPNLPVPRAANVVGVPLFTQREHQCGPAAMAAALETSGVSVSVEKLTEEVMSPSANGSLQLSLVTAARRNGRVPYELPPKVLALFREIAAGRPTVVLLNQSLAWLPIYHYAVLVGYDLNHSDMVLNSGMQISEHMSMTPFEHSWSRAGSWSIVLLKPDELPADPDRMRYLKAVSGVEAAGKLDTAEQAYRTALQRWPNDASASIGLANVLTKQQRNPEAIAVLQAARRAQPQHAAILNNLAQALFESGQYRDAEQAAAEASDIEGPFRDDSLETLRKIRSKQAVN